MKRIFLLISVLGVSLLMMAMPPKKRPHKPLKSMVVRMEPSSWWTGMKNAELQLMLYGEGIGRCKIVVKDNLLQVNRIERTKNPNYLFVYLDTKDAKAGVYDIIIRSPHRTQTLKYELKERKDKTEQDLQIGQTEAIYTLMSDRLDVENIIQHLSYIKELGMTTLCTNFYVSETNRQDSCIKNELIRLVDECHKYDLKYFIKVNPRESDSCFWWSDLPDISWCIQYENAKVTDDNSTIVGLKKSDKGKLDITKTYLNLKNKLLFDYLLQNYIYMCETTKLDGIVLENQISSDLNRITDLVKSIRAEYPQKSIIVDVKGKLPSEQ